MFHFNRLVWILLAENKEKIDSKMCTLHTLLLAANQSNFVFDSLLSPLSTLFLSRHTFKQIIIIAIKYADSLPNWHPLVNAECKRSKSSSRETKCKIIICSCVDLFGNEEFATNCCRDIFYIKYDVLWHLAYTS